MKIFFRYRLKQDSSVPGLSYNAKKNRRNRNLVSMKFNLVNWMFESLSTLLVFVNINRFSGLFYVLVMSCGTPIIYLIGIEENRFAPFYTRKL